MKSSDGARGVRLSATVFALMVSGSIQAAGLLRTVVLTGEPAPNLPAALGTGVFFSFWSPGLNDEGRTYFQSNDYVGGRYRYSKWVESSNAGLSLVLTEDVSVGGTIAQMEQPDGLTVGNEKGQLYFYSWAIQPPNTHTRVSAIWTNPPGEGAKLVAIQGMHPPGVPANAVFGPVIRDPVMNNNGHAAFSSDISGSGIFDAAGNRWCIWTTDASGALTLVARDGDHPVGMPADAKFGPNLLTSPIQINDLNEVYFSDDIISSAYTGRAILRYRASDGVVPVFTTGEPAPGLPTGCHFLGGGLLVARSGAVAYSAGVEGPGIDATNSFGIWVGPAADQLQLVARKGDTLPGLSSHIIKSLSVDAINRSGGILIEMDQTDGVSDPSHDSPSGWIQNDLWKYNPMDGLRFVAREGEHAPGTEDGTVFDSFLETTINDRGQVAFLADLTGPGPDGNIPNRRGVWAEDLAGTLRLIVREGDTIDVDDGPGLDLRMIEGLAVKLGGPTAESDGFNNFGQLAFLAQFEHSDGVFVSNLAAIPEPATCSLILIAVGAFLIRRRAWVRPLLAHV